MIPAPSNLVKQFGVDSSGHRAVSRALLAYTGPAKKRFLLVSFAGIMAGCLPEYGQVRKWRRDVTQSALAAMCGLARESFTRAMTEFATPDDAWTVERRLAQRAQTKAQHSRRGHRLHERDRAVRPSVATLIGRKRRFMRPNLYNFTLPERRDGKRPDKWFPMTAAEVRQDPEIREMFSRMADDDQGYQKFKLIPLWLWSPKLPLSWKARMVMTYYFLLGLGSVHSKTKKIISYVSPHQQTVAQALGISVHSVYNANRELTGIGLIRVAHPEPTIRRDGSYQRGPAMIFYMPIRLLDEETARYERLRFNWIMSSSLMASGRRVPEWQPARMRELHAELLAAWEGREHRLRAFWNELRRRATAEKIHQSFLDNIVPSPPE